MADKVLIDKSVELLIENIVHKAVTEALYDHCQFSDNTIAWVKHTKAMIADLDNINANPNKGTEMVREQIKFVKGLMATRNKIGNVIIIAIFGGIITFIGTLLYKGLKLG